MHYGCACLTSEFTPEDPEKRIILSSGIPRYLSHKGNCITTETTTVPKQYVMVMTLNLSINKYCSVPILVRDLEGSVLVLILFRIHCTEAHRERCKCLLISNHLHFTLEILLECPWSIIQTCNSVLCKILRISF